MSSRRRIPRVSGARVCLLAALLCLSPVAFGQAPEEAPKPLNGPTNTIQRAAPAAPKGGLSTPLTVNIREMDLTQAIRLLAEEAGLNVAVGKEIVGKVTCSLSNVSARTALDAFLRANGYDCVQTDGVLVVIKQGTPQSGAPAAAGVPQKIMRKTFRLPYTGTEQDSSVSGSTGQYASGASAAKSGKPLDEVVHAMLSPVGKMSYYERQHVIIVEDDESVITAIDDFVKVLWAMPEQVFIDSKLLEVSLEKGEDLGLRWTAQQKVLSNGKRNQATGAVESTGTIGLSTGPSMGLDKFFSFGVVNANLEVVLEALGTRKRVDLRSNPRVLVMNHRQATIVVGQEIPYLSSEQTVGGGESPIRTYAFKEVAVRLEVTPHISETGMIFLDVHPTVKSVIGYTDSPRQPILSTREAATNVAVHDGNTLIIGGLVQRGITRQRSEMPYLARIPLIGLLFRQKFDSDAKTDLLFMMSPRVVNAHAMEQMLEEKKNVTSEPPAHEDESPASNPKW